MSTNHVATSPNTPEAIASVIALYEEMRMKARPLVDEFEARYTAWKQTWDNPGEEADKLAHLTDLGIKVLPLIVHKLCSETEAKAIEPYNALEKKASYKSQSPTTIIANNYQRNLYFTESKTGWNRFKAENNVDVGGGYGDCDDYVDLTDLGMDIVPHCMLAYYDDICGWWDELLCVLISGHRSGAMYLFRDYTHRRWIEWFEGKDGETKAPYKLTGVAANWERFLRETGHSHPHAELEGDVEG